MIEVNEQFGFSSNQELTATVSKLAFEKYSKEFEQALKLGGNLPIFLDTSILLGYYGMSQVEKGKLINALKGLKERIKITKQIEREYLKNRVSVIKKDFFEPLTKVKADYEAFKSDVIKQLRKYKEEKKRILSNDYNSLWVKLGEIEATISKTLNDEVISSEMNESIASFNQKNKGILLQDEMLNIISSFETISNLNQVELSFVESEFDKLLLTYHDAKENSKWKFTFPGCGEKKEYPYGDFIIYHEILKFMKENDTSAIFLTNDVSKGDWLQKDKSIHIHYLENAFLHTRNVLFIVDGERTLPSISFENIHEGPLEILHATYGTSETDKQIDVTSKLKDLISNNKLTIKSSNEIAGDPHYGVLKDLSITYRIGDQEFHISIPEGATETIPL
ncbi:PIN-like domain-containing protein [Chitinophaga sp. NPDC101104]|uniref:PIN-like domain-containing protein n=1 Tax=Chitinophaga sp. NPDC101104 TaxID=3390561 RepID=UPI003CFEDD6C